MMQKTTDFNIFFHKLVLSQHYQMRNWVIEAVDTCDSTLRNCKRFFLTEKNKLCFTKNMNLVLLTNIYHVFLKINICYTMHRNLLLFVTDVQPCLARTMLFQYMIFGQNFGFFWSESVSYSFSKTTIMNRSINATQGQSFAHCFFLLQSDNSNLLLTIGENTFFNLDKYIW